MNKPFLTLGEFLAIVVALALLGLALYFTYRPEAELAPSPLSRCIGAAAEQCSCKAPEPPHAPLPWRKS